MPAAVIAGGKIVAVLMADATTDAVPKGYPADAVLIAAPAGCNETWTYDPSAGFKSPAPAPASPAPARASNKIEF
jgi:hypothetical protein